MGALKDRSRLPVRVGRDPAVMSGDPVVLGTRILAETIAAYLRDGYSREQIFEDFPTLPIGGIEAVEAWAEASYGADWLSRPVAHPAD